MPTNFERARSVIEQLLPIAAGLVQGDLDTMIRRRLRSLSASYGNGLLNQDRRPVDYTRTTTHIAYFYRSLSAHGDWLSKTLRRCRDHARRALNKGRPISVACIGGGPGSDILGICKFLIQEDLTEHRVDFVVLDRERAWNRSRSLLAETFDGELDITERYQSLDVTDDDRWTDDWAFCQSDMISMNFFLSEVWSFNGNGSISRFIQRVIDLAPRGTLFTYVDNGGDNFCPLADAEFNRNDVDRIISGEDERLLVSGEEQADVVMTPYRERFGGQWPKLKGKVAWRVWKKR